MRSITKFNENWKFIKEDIGSEQAVLADGEKINIPHTWNNIDGQDGGDDYYRGTCYYVKEMGKPELKVGYQAYLEFQGVNSSADVYVNGKLLCHHDGGYSTFRTNITGVLEENNTVVVAVDNAPNDRVYPQKADFTFYGGIYRTVSLVCVPENHFDLDYYGTPGIKVTPKIRGSKSVVQVETFVTGAFDEIDVVIEEFTTGKVVGTAKGQGTEITIENVHLWNGVKDPFLYLSKAKLLVNGEVIDEVSTRFGCRTFDFDSEKGFILNGRTYSLRGVSRHQDRKDIGNALTIEMHKEDMDLILEVGANTIRLAHYQHDQYFFDLCDEKGMVVWAEIPYITEHMTNGRDNTVSQMTELIVQNYNHPSIVTWGLSNEITVSGITDDLVENHKVLNNLAHKMDVTRPTTMACVFILETDHLILDIPDILSYNLYFGWYVGDTQMNAEWFDKFHKEHPDKICGLSEYGAEAVMMLQTGNPKKGDYTEEYQALYHEGMLKIFSERPYIWSTHAWNMFDFAADGRDEGGEAGMNHKGLVTFDRKIKKDAFYIYKAYLSDEPFVHVCGRRYVDRSEEITEVKVYSNQSKVALYNNGALIGEQAGNKVFSFKVPLESENNVEAKCGEYTDNIFVKKVTARNENYILKKEGIYNWFEEEGIGLEFQEGYFSIKDKMGDIRKTPDGVAIIENLMKNMPSNKVGIRVEMNETMQMMMNAMPVEDLLKQAGKGIKPEMVIQLSQTLNKIKKPE